MLNILQPACSPTDTCITFRDMKFIISVLYYCSLRYGLSFVTSLAKEVMVMLSVVLAGLSVCLSVSKITQKVMNRL